MKLLNIILLSTLTLLAMGCSAAYTSITPVDGGYYVTRVKNYAGFTVKSHSYYCQPRSPTVMQCAESSSP